MPNYTVKQGDSIPGIACKQGLPCEKIWDHPKNAALKERRKDPNVLFPGDTVFVPEKEERQEPGETEKRHQFRCRSRTTWLKVRFLNKGEPRANEPFVLDIEGILESGKLDGGGKLEVKIPADAKEATVFLGVHPKQEKYLLKIGHLDPLETIQGIKKRLSNLGFFLTTEGNDLDALTEAALATFQEKHGLQVKGQIDESTKRKMEEGHKW